MGIEGRLKRFARSLKHEDEAICYIATEANYTWLLKIMVEEITFGYRDCIGVEYLHTDTLVIYARIGPTLVHRNLIYNGNSINMLYKNTFNAMWLSEKDLHPCMSTLRVTNLTIELSKAPRTMVRQVQFVVLDGYSAYNTFLGRTSLSDSRVVTTIWCFVMKFRAPKGVGVMRGNEDTSRKCYVAELREVRHIEEGKSSTHNPCQKTVDV